MGKLVSDVTELKKVVQIIEKESRHAREEIEIIKQLIEAFIKTNDMRALQEANNRLIEAQTIINSAEKGANNLERICT